MDPSDAETTGKDWTLKSNQPLDQSIDVNLSETELEDEEDLAIDPTG